MVFKFQSVGGLIREWVVDAGEGQTGQHTLVKSQGDSKC
jgi:hypothetical protein